MKESNICTSFCWSEVLPSDFLQNFSERISRRLQRWAMMLKSYDFQSPIKKVSKPVWLIVGVASLQHFTECPSQIAAIESEICVMSNKLPP